MCTFAALTCTGYATKLHLVRRAVLSSEIMSEKEKIRDIEMAALGMGRTRIFMFGKMRREMVSVGEPVVESVIHALENEN